MKPVSRAALVAAALLLGHLSPLVAETARLRHLVSVYFDEKGVGFNAPEGIACDGEGRFVVGDTGNDRLLRFDYRDRTVTGGTEIKIAELSAPYRVELNSKGEIYALDARRRRIVRLGPDGAFKGTLSFEGVPPPTTIVPKSFDIDAEGQLHVLDVFSGRILVLDPDGKFQRALALPADRRFVSDVSVDFAGNVLLLDSVRRTISSAAKGAEAFVPFGGDLSATVITLPTYMTASRGAILVVEGGGSIVGFGRDGAFLARQLTEGWKDGSLQHPSQICVNDRDEVFVADRDNSRVQVFALAR